MAEQILSETVAPHTPAPWRIEQRGQLRWFVGSNGQGFGYLVGLGDPEDRANADLIAAAPDLLVALSVADIEQIVEAIENFVMGPTEDAELDAIWQPYIDKLKALRAAIAKAEGRDHV